MRLLTIKTLLLWVIISGAQTNAQSFLNMASYQVGLGSSSMLGDLGGADGKGTNFIKDFDYKSIRGSGSLSLDWIGAEHFEYRTNLSYIYLNANDQFSGDKNRRLRNLSVNSSIIEFAPTIKYNFTSNKKIIIQKLSGKKNIRFYLTLGTGFIYFNPKAEYNGKNYSLKKLSTEGQGLSNGAKEYSKISLVIPYGIGASKDINEKMAMFFELTNRKCFTDYLDDVSTVYYDNASLAANYGQESAALADRTIGDKHVNGGKRGNSGKKDSYFTLSFGFKKTFIKKDK